MMDSNDVGRVGPGRRTNAAERGQWRERFAASGLSRRDFAAQHNLRLQTLHGWLNEKGPARPSPSPAHFAEVPLPGLRAEPRWAAEVVRPDGLILRLAHDAPSALWQALLAAC